MYGVDLYGRVRLAVLGQGINQREAARRFVIDRGTVSKMVAHSVPLGYRWHVALRRPKLGAHTGFIDQILHDDIGVPKKQRHTIQRIYDRLREERGFDGGYTTVRNYVHPRRLSLKEARRRHAVMATSRRLLSLAACHSRSSTTTRGSRWRKFLATVPYGFMTDVDAALE